MNKRTNFRYGDLIYNIYSLLYNEEEIKPKGPNDVKHIAFGRIYYQLTEYPWKSIGITKNLLKKLEYNNFERNKILITRSHIYDRKDFLRTIFESKHKMMKDKLLAFLWEKDITIMSEKKDNKNITYLVDEGECFLFTPQDYENLFPAKQVGWKYTKRVIEKLKVFSKLKDKKEIQSNKNEDCWKIITNWY